MALVQIVLRIAHIAAAVALGGALLYQWLAVEPAARGLDEAQRRALRTGLARRWAGLAGAAAAVLLASGLLNFLVFKVPEYRLQPCKAVYHGLFGIKLVAALLLFHATALLVLPGPRFDRVRARPGRWLAYAAALLALTIVLAAVMRYLPALCG